jgi:Glycosyltransferase 61
MPADTKNHGTDAEILTAVDAVIAGRQPGEVVRALFHSSYDGRDEAMDHVAQVLPAGVIQVVRFVEGLRAADLNAVIILLAALRKTREDDSWIHYNLANRLYKLRHTGVEEAKLPAIIHAQLAIESFKDVQPSALPLPLNVLAREMANFAPRVAVRSGILSARHGNEAGLRYAGPAIRMLGLAGGNAADPIVRTLELAKELDLRGDATVQTTSLANAAGRRSAAIELPRRIVSPQVLGDSDHYIFAGAGKELNLPGITVTTLERGIFSIDATARGLEQHYVFDQNGDCLLGFANGTEPFIAETVFESDVPVAILDDRFSGAMNICHFLLDHLTRIPIYERTWTTRGKYFMVDDYPYYRDILARIGLTDQVIIPDTKRISVRAPEILFSSNIAADHRHPAHYCADWAMNYLRRVFKIDERPSHPSRKIAISRTDATARRIVNWEETASVLRRHGFEIVELAELPTESQIVLFRDCAQVVGVHGAGLTNLLFAPRDCSVLEILPPLAAAQSYWWLASGLGQRYVSLIADDPELPRPDYKTWGHDTTFNDRDVVVPVNRLESALAGL